MERELILLFPDAQRLLRLLPPQPDQVSVAFPEGEEKREECH